MSSVNKAILLGNLGKDPELRYVASGNAVCNFSLATSESWTDKSGVKSNKTTWHNIVVWGKLAEVAKQYLAKGKQVYIEGKIENRSYDDKSGNKRYVSEVVVDMGGKLVFVGNNPEQRTGDDQRPPTDDQNNQQPQSSDDLPF